MKNLLNLGATLNKAEQKAINGGQFICSTICDPFFGRQCFITKTEFFYEPC